MNLRAGCRLSETEKASVEGSYDNISERSELRHLIQTHPMRSSVSVFTPTIPNSPLTGFLFHTLSTFALYNRIPSMSMS